MPPASQAELPFTAALEGTYVTRTNEKALPNAVGKGFLTFAHRFWAARLATA
jgi:hypothetical protein